MFRDRDEDKKEKKEEKNEEEDKKRKRNDELNEKRETCGKVIKGGLLGIIGSSLLTAAGVAITPFCPAVGVPMTYTGATGIAASSATSFGGAVADTVYENKIQK